jgi:hypothetical protein
MLGDAPVQLVFESFPISSLDGPSPDQNTLFLSVFVFDNGVTSQRTDIREVDVFNGDALPWRGGSAVGTNYTGGWFRFKPNGVIGRFPLDEYKIVIPTYDADYRKDVLPSAAVSGMNQHYDYVYAPEYAGKVEVNYLSALARPEISKAKLVSGAVDLVFRVSDARAVTGAVTFLDKEGQIVAHFFPFADESSAEAPAENVGDYHLFNDGRDNVMRIKLDRLSYKYEKTGDNVWFATVTVRSGFLGKVVTPRDQVLFSSGSAPHKVERPN